MKIGTYNVEWFAGLFDQENQLLLTNDWSSRRDVTKARQLEAIAEVIRAIDADCLLIVEAPDTSKTVSTKTSLLNFSEHFGLRLNAVETGFVSDTQQELALFYDDRLMTAKHDPKGSLDREDPAPRFDGQFLRDVDVDDQPEEHVFSKPPLEVELVWGKGRLLRLIGVHIKSKAPHGAKTREDEARISIANRRKQLVQSLWLRRRVEEHLRDSEDVIVLGDFNDGPGLDAYEKLFGHSSVEVVLGTTNDPKMKLFDPHAIARLDPRDTWSPSTARFYQHHRKTYLNALLDFIMVSPKIAQNDPAWKIWHPFDDQNCFKEPTMQQALLDASDHFPVTLEIGD